MLGADVAVAETTSMILRLDNDCAGSGGKAFEHVTPVGDVCGGRSAW